MMQQLASKVMLTDADFKQIKCPVLLSVGDKDHTAGLEQTLSIYRKLPNASLWVIPNTAHVFEQVDREALHHQLLRFFSEV
jgi:pimeloyl-ACP methyl ester carboxylesterase